MAITADNYGQYLANYQPTTDYAPSASTAAVRKPGNWATHLLPIAGSILGGLVGGIPGAAIGGGLAKVGENKLEKQSLGNGVVGQGVLGGVSEGVGGLVAPVIGKVAGGAGSFISNLLGREGTDAAVNAGTDAAVQGAAQAPTSAAEAVPGSSSGWLDKILGRSTPTPAVAEGTGAVEVGQGGNIIKLGSKEATSHASILNSTEAASQIGGATPGHELATAATPYSDSVKNYLQSKGINLPDNPLYNEGSKITASSRGLDQAFKGSLKAPDMATASNTLLDTLGHGGPINDQFTELPDIHQTVTNDLKGVLADNTNKIDGNELIDRVNKIPETEFNIKPTDGMPIDKRLAEETARAVPGSTSQQVDSALNKAGDIIKRYADGDGNISAQGLLNINQEIGDLIKPQQWNALRGIGDAAVTPADQANFKIWQETRQALEKVSPEASDILKVQSLTGHELPNALQSGIADGGAVRVSGAGRLRNIPGVEKVFQAGQSGIGRALQGLGGATPQLAETAKAVVPQILGHNIGSSVSNEQEQEKNVEASAAAPDLSAPSSDIQDTLKGVNQPNALGIDPEKIKQAELADLVATGGKNLPALSKIESVVNATQGPTLSAGGTQATADYQNSIQALQGLNSVFNSNASTTDVSQALTQTLPTLTKATGLAKTDLVKLLPSATDDQATVNSKLTDIKNLIDQKANQTLQTDVTKTSPDSTSSLISSLLGQGAS